jgi:hypothetical protein
MRKVELLVTLRGNDELWLAGQKFDYDSMPGEIAAEIALDRGTVRVFEEVTQVPAVPPPAPPPSDEPSFSEVAKSLLDADLEAEIEEEEAEIEEVPRFFAKHRGAGRWVVLDGETGERMNEEYLKKKPAKDLAKKLNEEQHEQTEALSTDEALASMDEEERPSLDLGGEDG